MPTCSRFSQVLLELTLTNYVTQVNTTMEGNTEQDVERRSRANSAVSISAVDRLRAATDRTWSERELVQHAVQMLNEIAIEDRDFHFRTYENCFVGREAVDWMIKSGTVEDRVEALQLGNQMLQAGLIHHVLDEHGFKDMNLFYR